METSLLGGLLSSVQTSINSSLGEAMPVVGTVFALIAGISVGFKLFKKFTGVRA